MGGAGRCNTEYQGGVYFIYRCHSLGAGLEDMVDELMLSDDIPSLLVALLLTVQMS